jgi:hypothetical protein
MQWSSVILSYSELCVPFVHNPQPHSPMINSGESHLPGHGWAGHNCPQDSVIWCSTELENNLRDSFWLRKGNRSSPKLWTHNDTPTAVTGPVLSVPCDLMWGSPILFQLLHEASCMLPWTTLPASSRDLDTESHSYSSTMLNRSGDKEHPCLFPDFRGNGFSFSPLSMMLAVGLSYIPLQCWGTFLFFLVFLELLSW